MGNDPLLNLRGATIVGELGERNPPISLPNQSNTYPLLALDIGGSLIKLVYFKADDEGNAGGKLHFVKFQTRSLDECLEFIKSFKFLGNGLMHEASTSANLTLKATGGGAYKFSDVIREKLGVTLHKLDEIDSVVAGANFLLKKLTTGFTPLMIVGYVGHSLMASENVPKIPCESFIRRNGRKEPININTTNLFPYLLVNIGSGVSMIKVMGNKKFERVTGTQVGAGTMFGLAKLLTGCMRYDEFLELSRHGDNLVLDLIVKDICGELVGQKQGLSASTLASSFGKVINSRKKLSDYKAEDLATTLLSAFTYNIAQVSYLVAALLGLKRVFFGGSYIRGHASTMDNISYAIDYWSKGQMQALFLCHEGFLGALGAFMDYGNVDTNDLALEDTKEKEPLHDTFASADGTSTTEHNESSIFPYLLVNIGSGVSMVEVTGKGKFERIIGTHLGGGTILGLARLLTGCASYEEFLELSQRGNTFAVDLTVGDIYGEHGYSKHKLPASTTAASFGKVSSNKLSDYKAEDLAAALLNAFTYNIGQISYFVAKLSGLRRIFFRGTYVCGHAKIMEKISRSLKYWSKDELQTTFLCHEGFIGAVGAFWSYENMGIANLETEEIMKQVLLGAPYTAGNAPALPLATHLSLRGGGDGSFRDEVERLQHDNNELKTEIERLQHENAQLKAALQKIRLDTSFHGKVPPTS